jgi:hypothetical protein
MLGGRLLVELPAKPGSHLPSGLRELAHRETKTIAAAAMGFASDIKRCHTASPASAS